MRTYRVEMNGKDVLPGNELECPCEQGYELNLAFWLQKGNEKTV